MKNKLFFTALIALFSVFAFSGCEEEESNTIYDVLKSDERFTSLVAAIDEAGIQDALTADGTLTLFAPTNAAFTSAAGKLNGLSASELTTILQYHVLNSTVLSSQLSAVQTVEALGGGDLFIRLVDGSVNINGIGSLSIILNTTLNGNFHRHAAVTEADIEADNGVIHAIDYVLLPDAHLNLLEAAAKRYYLERAAQSVAAGNLATTDSPLVGAGPLTLFAPINPPNPFPGLLSSQTENGDAFSLIDAQNINLAADLDQLAFTLLLHTAAGNQTSSNITSAGVVTTNAVHPQLGNVRLNVTQAGGAVYLRSALITDDQTNASAFNSQVVEADIVCSNGTLHLINNLLLPAIPTAPTE